MKGPNLSAWAIRHPALIRYLVSLVVLADAQAGWRPKNGIMPGGFGKFMFDRVKSQSI